MYYVGKYRHTMCCVEIRDFNILVDPSKGVTSLEYYSALLFHLHTWVPTMERSFQFQSKVHWSRDNSK